MAWITRNAESAKFKLVNQGAAGTLLVEAAMVGARHKVLGYMLQLQNAGSWQFTDGAGALTGTVTQIKDAAPYVLQPSIFPLIQTAIGSPLNLVTTGAGAHGVIIYVTEPIF